MAASHKKSSATAPLPKRPVDRLLGPIHRFLHIEAASGVVLLVAAAAALYLANSPWAADFVGIWKTPVEFAVGTFRLKDTLGHLVINDGLMTIFFFVVGLEIKRELVGGELAEPRKALLPVVAAVGGMLVPALVYYALQRGQPGERGWAIPMATDIAFVVGFLALFGSRVPFGLKIFLLSLAIVDDLGAVLIIAFVFSESIAWPWLGAAGVALVATVVLNVVGVRRVSVYVIVGVFIWLAFLKAHVHPTVAGVLLGLLTPSKPWLGTSLLSRVIDEIWDDDEDELPPQKRVSQVSQVEFAARETVAPLHRLEAGLHPWVAFGIMPLFALANAGVKLDMAGFGSPVATAVAAGLVIGKPVGILLFTYLAVRIGAASLPDRVTWPMTIGAAALGGIGFTMALFLNGLAFPKPEDALLAAAGKIGVLAGSLLSAVIGCAVVAFSVRRRSP
jgi:NhaA family Na+:H+ antiporter